MLERRAHAVAADGRTASGVAMPYGVSADVRLPSGERVTERFEAGSILYAPGLVVNRNHDAGDVLADLNGGTLRMVDGPDALRFEARLSRPVDATAASVEFVALKERRMGRERIVGQAALLGLALLDGVPPAYHGADVEVRQAATLTGRSLAGRWDGGRERIERATGSGRRKTRPTGLVQLDFEADRRDVILRWDQSPLASRNAGTLTLAPLRNGGFTFDASNLPKTRAAEDLREWLGAGNRVYPDPTLVGVVEDVREPGTGLSAGSDITVGVMHNPILTAITLTPRERWAAIARPADADTPPAEDRASTRARERLWL